MHDPIDSLPAEIRDTVRRILEDEVAGGNARYQKTKCRRGVQGQKAISRIMQDAGVSKSDPRWKAVNKYGQDLYYGRDIIRTR